jgi:hypothetical protein
VSPFTFRASAIAISLCALMASSEAGAYSEETHQRIVEAAVEAMLSAEAAPAPQDVSATEWGAYTQRVRGAALGLAKLRTGLLGAYRMTLFPDPTTTLPGLTYNDPGICKYQGSNQASRDFNLINATNIRIGDFTYYANKQYVPCAYTALSATDHPDRLGGALGPTLGWHAQSIDARVDDTILWVRPTHAGVTGLVLEATNKAVEFGLGAVLVPFVCLAELLIGGDCDIDDAFDLATRVNPVTLVEGLIPGIGPISSTDYVGVWHFIDVGASSNRYNDIRGMHYEGAGPEHPGALDVAIMAASDIAGLSLNAFSSEGPERYGRYDRIERTVTQWQAHTLGHVEFSPVDNLARGGWDAFVADPTTAQYLSWPLHAIGDAAAPHHVVGTTAWGHRPFEDSANKELAALLPTSADALAFDEFRKRVLRIGFDAARAFQADPSIQAFIEREAHATRTLARADGDWVFQDGLSILWQIGSETAANAPYRGALARVRPFVEHSVGHTIALLARAGELARDLGVDPQTLCPVGGHFTGEGTGCADGPAPPPPAVVPLPFGLSPIFEPQVCQAYGDTCGLESRCCDNVPCTSGRCRYP